jgi:hypothetical protein
MSGKPVQRYPLCPLCNREQSQFPPDMFGPCKQCIDLNPEGVKEFRQTRENSVKDQMTKIPTEGAN